MYYFDFSQIDFGDFNFRPYSLYNEGTVDIAGTATVVANAKTIVYCNSDIVGESAIVVTESHLYGKLYGDSDIVATGTVVSDALLKHYGKLEALLGTGGVIANAKRIIYAYRSSDMNCSASVAADSNLYTLLYGDSDIVATGEMTTGSLLKHYGKIGALQCTGEIVSNEKVILYATVSISGHADMNTDSIRKQFEEASIAGTSTVQSNSVLAWVEKCNITANASLGGESNLTITGSAAITATADLQVTDGVLYLKTGITDADTYSFPMSDKTYIYNGTDFLYFDGSAIGNVTDIAYVPTISKTRTPAGVGVAHEKLNFLSPSWKDSFNGTVGDTAYTLSYDADSVVVYTDGVLVDPADYTFPTGTDYGIVTFDSAQGEGVDNVVITGTKAGLTDPTAITKCTQFIVYGGKNDNRVFACRLNVRYHSGLEDATYWPIDAFEIITSDAEDITGFGKMIDYLINLKKRSLTYTNIDVDSSGNTIWPIYPLNDEYGCIAKDTIKSVNNGLIFLAGTNEGSPAGVAYLSTSTVRDQLNVQIISRDINTSVDLTLTGLLGYTTAELTGAKAYLFDDKYWLKVGDRCWILDLKMSDFSEKLYCWYPYDGIPADANCFLDYSGDLYLGHDTNGLIYKESTSDDEDGSALDFYWTSPIISCGTRTWMKDFEELFVTFGRQVIGNNKLTFITDDGKEEVLVAVQSANLFDFASIDFSAWSFGANPFPSTQPEIVGYSAEYLQWKIQNDTLSEGLVILGQELTYRIGERV